MEFWRNLFGKKFTAMVIGVVATFLSRYLKLPEEQITEIIVAIVAYILAQGVADNGKEAAKILKEDE